MFIMYSSSDANEYIRDETTVWSSKVNSNHVGYFIYIFLVPMFCLFGIITNFLNAIIFSRPRMVSSSYIYFTALSCLDLLSCILLWLSCLARTVHQNEIGWRRFDLFVFLPVSGITSSASNFVTLAVVIDRVIYMKACLPKSAPKYCTPLWAKKIIPSIIITCIVINLPYFFIYKERDGHIKTSEFFESLGYCIYNWIKFMILIVSSLALIGSNGMMISIMRQWYNRSYLLRNRSSSSEKKQLFSQTQLTLTIIVVVFLFLIGEIPMYFVSRCSAITMLFQGDLSKSSSQDLETFRIIATFLYALHISLNIAIYTSLNPPYFIELFDFLQIICLKCHWKVFSNNSVGNASHKIISHSSETSICIIHGISDDSTMSKKFFKRPPNVKTTKYTCTCPSTLPRKEMIEIENNDYVEIVATHNNITLDLIEICATKSISGQCEQEMEQHEYETIDDKSKLKLSLSGIGKRISYHKSFPTPTISKSENHLNDKWSKINFKNFHFKSCNNLDSYYKENDIISTYPYIKCRNNSFPFCDVDFVVVNLLMEK